MSIYALQSFFRHLPSSGVRFLAIKAARSLGVRHLVTRIDTNDICNLRCVMCPVSNPDYVPVSKPMTVDQFKHIGDQLLARTRYLYLSCATEPLATPHFDKILECVADYHVPFVSYCTNGLLLRDRFIDATLKTGVDEVIFSVDGATAATYEPIRVGGKWDDLVEKLDLWTAARRKFAGDGPEVRFNFTAQSTNSHEIEAFVRLTERWDADVIQIRLFRPLEGALKQTDDECTVENYRSQIPIAARLCEARGIRLLHDPIPTAAASASDTVPAESAETDGPEEPIAEIPRPDRLDCQLPWITVYVKSNGDYYPCSVHPKVGNLVESSYREIDRGAELRTLRQSLRSCPKQICVECKQGIQSGF